MLLPLIAMILFPGAPVPVKGAEAKALEELSGIWVVTSTEAFGRAGELHLGDVFTFNGGVLSHDTGKGEALRYRVAIVPGADTRRMDWTPTTPKDAECSHCGIYKIEDGKLTICVIPKFDGADEKDRPSEFRTKASREKGEAEGSVLLVLTRKPN